MSTASFHPGIDSAAVLPSTSSGSMNVIAFAAGNFLYVAMADLIPTLHHSGLDKNATRQLILIGLGMRDVRDRLSPAP